MIASALLAGGSASALIVAWQVAPAVVQRLAPGSGLHRYAMSPADLRRENAHLMCALTKVSGDRDNAVRSALEWQEAANLAATRIDELTAEASEVKQLREANTGLRAELANARPIRPLLADRAEEDTLPHGIAIAAGSALADPGRIDA
ncbi:MAG: hypothetical protein HOY79_50005 [Streptomyces sp.]|nr:hypothetical protein [Streptomyces sp.]